MTGARNLSYIVVGVIIWLLIEISAPSATGAPKGVFLPAQKTYPALSADQVKVFYQTTPSHSYQVVGLLNVQNHSHNNPAIGLKKSQQEDLQYAKSLAAKNGANGIIISNNIGYSPDGQTSAFAIQWAQAIRY